MKKYFVFMSDHERNKDIRDWMEAMREVAEKTAGEFFSFTGDIAEADEILVVGGDGRMLEAFRRYADYNLPFIGINRGTFGFLLNPVSAENVGSDMLTLLKDYESHKTLELNLLEVEFEHADGKKEKAFAFNDVYLKSSKLSGEIEGLVSHYLSHDFIPDLQKKFKGDGVVVGSPQGSSAYTKNAGGYILHLEDKLLTITSICANEQIKEVVDMKGYIAIQITRGKATGIADRKEFPDVKSAMIRPAAKAVRIIFSKDYNYQLKRFQLK